MSNNILKIEIEEEGGGYQSPPELKFDCDYGMACPPQYNCILEDGKLVDVELVTVGCGYVTPLTITVSEPEEGEKRAIVSAKIFNKVEITYPTFG